jgi:putative addiction module component (TIGR02574 family)
MKIFVDENVPLCAGPRRSRHPQLITRSIPPLTPGFLVARLPFMKLADFPKLKALPARKKLQLAEELWFDGVSDESLPVPTWHKELLSDRMAAYKAGKLKTISVEELKRRLGVK